MCYSTFGSLSIWLPTNSFCNFSLSASSSPNFSNIKFWPEVPPLVHIKYTPQLKLTNKIWPIWVSIEPSKSFLVLRVERGRERKTWAGIARYGMDWVFMLNVTPPPSPIFTKKIPSDNLYDEEKGECHFWTFHSRNFVNSILPLAMLEQ